MLFKFNNLSGMFSCTATSNYFALMKKIIYIFFCCFSILSNCNQVIFVSVNHGGLARMDARNANIRRKESLAVCLLSPFMLITTVRY